MSDSNSSNFTYAKAEKKCPSCGQALMTAIREAGIILFCVREHGTRDLPWAEAALPVATRTARGNRFMIDGEDGLWIIPSHIDAELQHDGPPAGSVIAAIKRYRSRIPTAVVFVRRNRRVKKKTAPAKPGRSYGVFIEALKHCRKEGSLALTRDERPDRSRCLTPDCDCKVIARGLCKSCNNSAHILVDDGGATWGELEDYGLSRATRYTQKLVGKVILDQTFQIVPGRGVGVVFKQEP